MAHAIRPESRKDSQARHAERNWIRHLRQVFWTRRQLVRCAIAKLDARNRGKLSLRKRPLCWHYFGGTVKRQLDAPVGKVFASQIFFQLRYAGSAQFRA